MRQELIFIFILLYCANITAQENSIIGHWTLSQHLIYDSIQNEEVNIYTGQINRTIDFYKNGKLVLILNDGESVNGKWNISRNGRKFKFKSDLNGFNLVSTLKNSRHDFEDGRLEIPFDYLYELYTNKYDSLEGGVSVFKKTNSALFIPSDTTNAHQFYLTGLKLLEQNPDDAGGQAIKSFRKANKLRPYYYWKGYSLIAQYTYFTDENALEEINAAIEINHNNSDLYSSRAVIKAHWGKEKEALEDINWALILERENAHYFFQRASILKNYFREYELAKKDISSAILIDSENSSYYFERALIYYEMGFQDEACADFVKANELGYTGWIYHMADCGIER